MTKPTMDQEWGQEPVTKENRYLPNPKQYRPWPRQNRGKNPQPASEYTILEDEQDFIGWAKWLVEVADPYTWADLDDLTNVEIDEAGIARLYQIMCHLADRTDLESMDGIL